MRIFVITVLSVGIVAPLIQARPVSYPSGVTLMLMSDSERHSVHVHYSPTARISLGYRFEDWRNRNFKLHAVQMNNLLKRWNKKYSQANLYLKSGLGVVNPDFNNDRELAGFTGIAVDWENRRHFVSYENRFTQAGDVDDFYQQSARVGWAPYVGNYGDLHTWLMLDIRHMPEADDKIVVTPLLRLFKDIHLVEAGVSDNGDVTFNYIFRY